MTRIVYTLPMSLTPQNNSSRTAKVLIMVKDCNSFTNPNEDCDGWNFNRCPNDEDYCQPFIEGDKIYGQLKFDQTKYTVSSIQVINTATGANFYNDSFATIQTGRDEINNFYFNYVLDTANALFDGVTCFYTKIVITPKQGGDAVYYTSEPYCIVQCNEETLLILGSYPNGYDCFGGYYGSVSGGVNSGASIYLPQVRIRGVIENDNFDFEKTINNNKTIKSKQFERFILKSKLIPYYVVRQVAVCFNSKEVSIDGTIYSGTISLKKNNDEGNMWILNETIFQECDEINFTCD